jgi:hypothetical protein
MPETIIGTKTNPYNPLNSRDIAKVLANAIAGDINRVGLYLRIKVHRMA